MEGTVLCESETGRNDLVLNGGALLHPLHPGIKDTQQAHRGKESKWV